MFFLDELPEYKKPVLDVLRQPLEDRQVTISRAVTSLSCPSGFMRMAAMNPCPCRQYASRRQACRCTGQQDRRCRSMIARIIADLAEFEGLRRPARLRDAGRSLDLLEIGSMMIK